MTSASDRRDRRQLGQVQHGKRAELILRAEEEEAGEGQQPDERPVATWWERSGRSAGPTWFSTVGGAAG